MQIRKLDVDRDAAIALRCKDYTQALREMFKVSDYDSYESLSAALGMDKARFSRCLSKPDAHFTDEQMRDYMALTASVIAPLYLLHAMGLDPGSIRFKQTETEKQLAAVEKERDDLRNALKCLMEAKS